MIKLMTAGTRKLKKKKILLNLIHSSGFFSRNIWDFQEQTLNDPRVSHGNFLNVQPLLQPRDVDVTHEKYVLFHVVPKGYAHMHTHKHTGKHNFPARHTLE